MRYKVMNSWTIEVPEHCSREVSDDGFVIFDVPEGESNLRIFTVVYLLDDPFEEYLDETGCGEVKAEDDENETGDGEGAEDTLHRYLACMGRSKESMHSFVGDSSLAGYGSVEPGRQGELLFQHLVAAPGEVLVISSDCSSKSLPLLLQIWNSALKEDSAAR